MADFNTSVAKSKNWSEFVEQLDYNEDHYLLWFKPGVDEPFKIKLKNIVFPGQPATKITDLTDTPNTLLGQKGKILVVSQDETTFEYKVLAEVSGVTQQELTDALATKEDALGNPDVDGKVLSSLADGTRSWVVLPQGSSYTPPAPYATVAALLADQGNQIEHEEYTVEDASGWSTITSGWATFQKKATSTASESDYVLREKEESGSGVQSVTGTAVDNTDPLNPVVNIPASSTPKEHEINGVRQTLSISGTLMVDWSLYSLFDFSMTADTTLTDTNLPTGTNTKVIELIITGNFALTLPAYWEAEPGNDAYDGTVRNHLVVTCIKGDSGVEDVIYQLTNLA